jgi:hypothetical protein
MDYVGPIREQIEALHLEEHVSILFQQFIVIFRLFINTLVSSIKQSPLAAHIEKVPEDVLVTILSSIAIYILFSMGLYIVQSTLRSCLFLVKILCVVGIVVYFRI